jgi:oxygen-independent coproporphyrinogen-3 oxidase
MNQKSELLRKYNVAGPRYTSYPTVPYWETSPTVESWVKHLGAEVHRAEAAGLGAALYVHIPFCESLCTYCGCNTRITRNHGVESPYVDTVLAEWALYRQALGIGAERPFALTELHLGGGTPTFLSPRELARLVDGILVHCRVTADSEFSIEVDPRVTTREHLAVLAERGFNRLSLGVQDFDPKVQDIVHRVQSKEQVATVTTWGRELGYKSVNYDLIYGLPLQTKESIDRTIAAVERLRPDRIAFYAYAHVPWIKASQRRFTEADLPDGEAKRELYEWGRSRLERAGYAEVGMDHFALLTDSLWTASRGGALHRNFMGYTARHVSPQLGLGVSAISDSWTCFAQNEKVLEKYQDLVRKGQIPIFRGHELTAEDLVIRRHVLKLMTTLRTDWKASDTNTEYLTTVNDKLAEFKRDGLVESGDHWIQVTEAGRAFLRNICMAFDARLARKAPNTELFSKTI